MQIKKLHFNNCFEKIDRKISGQTNWIDILPLARKKFENFKISWSSNTCSIFQHKKNTWTKHKFGWDDTTKKMLHFYSLGNFAVAFFPHKILSWRKKMVIHVSELYASIAHLRHQQRWHGQPSSAGFWGCGRSRLPNEDLQKPNCNNNENNDLVIRLCQTQLIFLGFFCHARFFSESTKQLTIFWNHVSGLSKCSKKWSDLLFRIFWSQTQTFYDLSQGGKTVSNFPNILTFRTFHKAEF